MYIDGYDSHAYNAYHYWKSKFPEVQLVPTDTTLRTFILDIDGVSHAVIEGMIIETPEGNQMKVEDYYDSYT